MLYPTFLVSGLSFLQDVRRHFCNKVRVREFLFILFQLSGQLLETLLLFGYFSSNIHRIRGQRYNDLNELAAWQDDGTGSRIGRTLRVVTLYVFDLRIAEPCELNE